MQYASDPATRTRDHPTNVKAWNEDIQNKITVSGKDVNDFLRDFMPFATSTPFVPTASSDTFAKVPIYDPRSKRCTSDDLQKKAVKAVCEPDMYGPLVDGFNAIISTMPVERRMCAIEMGDSGPYVKPIHETEHPTRPDCAAFHPGRAHTPSSQSFDWGDFAFTLEVKRNEAHDPINAETGELKATGTSRAFTLQVVKNARNLMHGNLSCFVFVVAIFGSKARFFRFDRAGAVVSQPFDYVVDPQPVSQFLWRLAHGRQAGTVLGADLTVAFPSPEEKERLADLIRAHHASLVSDAQVALDTGRWITVPFFPERSQGNNGNEDSNDARKSVEADSTGPTLSSTVQPKLEMRRYFTVNRLSCNTSLFSRATVVWDVITEDEPEGIFVLKDSWREASRKGETEFYAMLVDWCSRSPDNAAGLPEYVHGVDLADVDLGLDQCNWHATVSAVACQNGRVERRHMRTVVKTLGRSLTGFTSTRELVEALRDAVKGHRNAYNAGVLHRDISIGNVMIHATSSASKGFIHDFDYSLVIPTSSGESTDNDDAPESSSATKATAGPRERTGTYYFMAVDMLNLGSEGPHALKHDLESVYWLLIFIVLRHTKHTHAAGAFACAQLFDNWEPDRAAGQKIWWAHHLAPIAVVDNAPLTWLLSKLHALIGRNIPLARGVPSVEDLTYELFLGPLNEALAMGGWPTSDGSLQYPPAGYRIAKHSTDKRSYLEMISSDAGSSETTSTRKGKRSRTRGQKSGMKRAKLESLQE